MSDFATIKFNQKSNKEINNTFIDLLKEWHEKIGSKIKKFNKEEKPDHNNTNYQDKIKMVAIVAMIIDHLGSVFLSNFEILRVIGRISAPIFFFFCGYNFKNHNRPLLLVYGILLVINSWIVYNTIHVNILFTIFLGNLYLNKIYSHSDKFVSNLFQIFPLILFAPATNYLFEYGTIGFAFMLIGYLCKNNKENYYKYILIYSLMICFSGQILFWFDFYNFILLIIMSYLVYYLFQENGFENLVGNKIMHITRNSLMIYFVHLEMFFLIRLLIW